jgi:2-phosphosulfolactate phosphatase
VLSLAAGATTVLAGCLRNARAVAAAAARLGRRVAVIAAGERWFGDEHDDHSLRPAAEDWVGAGAIIAHLPGSRSPEADLALAGFRAVRGRLPAFLEGCSSGRELIARGTAADVALAAQLNVSDVAPRLVDGAYVVSAGDGP